MLKHAPDATADIVIVYRPDAVELTVTDDGHRYREPVARLTARERELLVAVEQGRSNAEIAQNLHISLATTRTHVSHLLTKLDVRDRVQLTIVAYESGLVQPGNAN